MKKFTDEQLMVLIRNGDLQMMRELFVRYHVRIYNYCLKLTRNRVVSEDLTQETFYKIIRYRDSFNNKTFAPWIFTIARNLCMDDLKKHKGKIFETVALAAESQNCQDDDSDKNERIEHLSRALDLLDYLDKELIVLSRYEKLKYAQIAEIMNLSEAAVKTRIHRAMQKLRAHYFTQHSYESK